MFIAVEELTTHLYQENIDVIARADNTIVMAAIDTATQEAKGYLSDYDRDEIFSQVGSNRNALLLTLVKDVAVWHFINLSNAGSDMELRQLRYERAIDWLKSVRRGDVTPDLPKLIDDTGKVRGGVIAGSNPKKTQHF